MAGGSGKQQSATTRDAQAPKRKEMRSTTVGVEVEECGMAQLVAALAADGVEKRDNCRERKGQPQEMAA
jgi:hypothetical protein